MHCLDIPLQSHTGERAETRLRWRRNPTLRGREQDAGAANLPLVPCHSELLPHISVLVPMSVSISHPRATGVHIPTLGRNAPFHC